MTCHEEYTFLFCITHNNQAMKRYGLNILINNKFRYSCCFFKHPCFHGVFKRPTLQSCTLVHIK